MSKHYSNTAAQAALSSSVNAVATTIVVTDTTGFPAVDFALALDSGTVNEELVLVTGVAGLNLTVTRGYDNTTAVSHDTGATVIHSHSAGDFADARTHEAATAAHGATGAVMGTTNVQTVTNKDLTSGTNTFPSTLATDAEISSAVAAHAALTATHGVTGAVVGTTNAQTLVSKTIPVDSNTLSGIAVSSFVLSDPSGNIDGLAAAKAIPAGVVVGTTDAQTLTNKTLTSPVLNTPTVNNPTFAITPTALALTAAAGWGSITVQRAVVLGPLVYLDLRLSRSGATLTASSNGNLVDTQVISAGLPGALTPTNTAYLTFVQNGVALGTCRINTDGTVQITDMYPTATITSGDAVTLSGFYLLG